jgi:hypothetical protein
LWNFTSVSGEFLDQFPIFLKAYLVYILSLSWLWLFLYIYDAINNQLYEWGSLDLIPESVGVNLKRSSNEMVYFNQLWFYLPCFYPTCCPRSCMCICLELHPWIYKW